MPEIELVAMIPQRPRLYLDPAFAPQVLDGKPLPYEPLSSTELARMISLGDPWLVVVDVRDTDCAELPSDSI